MRVDVSQLLAAGGIKIKTDTGLATGSLRKGDVLRAEVVSRDNSGVLTLKMENGHSFSAKLGTDLKLSVGDMLTLEVMEKDNDRISLSFTAVESAEDDLPLAGKNIVRDFSDKSLAPYANKLSQLGMPVTEKSALMMRELIALNPNLTLDEAAFLVSNKLTEDPNLMQAALRILASGEKTDALIAKLISSLESSNSASPEAITAQNTAPLTNLLAAIVKNSSSLMEALSQLKQGPSHNAQSIITQGEGNMQTNVTNVGENLSQAGNNVGTATPQEAGQALQQQGLQGSLATTLPGAAAGESPGENAPAAQPPAAGIIPPSAAETPQISTPEASQAPVSQEQTAQNTPASPLQNPDPAQANQDPNAHPPQVPNSDLGRMFAQLLSQVPQFSGTPQSALQQFSEMLLRVAGDTVGAAEGETLEAQLEKLFTKIDGGDVNSGNQLRQAREELFARLAMLEEAASKVARQSGSEVLSQTHRLMDHVRTLNSIEQFVYMQLPVSLNDQRKAAELYIFKRKGSRRADPDNVNILMALDLEFMGHWEALLNIKGKDITLNMEVRGEAEKEHFNQNTVMLHRLLDEEGFKLVGVNVKLFEKETTPLTALTAIDRYQGKKQTGIDIRW